MSWVRKVRWVNVALAMLIAGLVMSIPIDAYTKGMVAALLDAIIALWAYWVLIKPPTGFIVPDDEL